MATLPTRSLMLGTLKRWPPVSKRSFASSSARHGGSQTDPEDTKTAQFARLFQRFVAIGASFFILGVIFTYSLPFRTNTPEGRAMDKILRKDWENSEAREGGLGRLETKEQYKEEKEYRKAHPDQPKGDVP